MKVIITTNNNIRKLELAYSLGGLTWINNIQPELLGDRFLNGYILYNEIIFKNDSHPRNKKEIEKIVEAFLDESSTELKLKKIGIDYNKFKNLLKNFDVPIVPIKDSILINFKNKFKNINKYSQLINKLMKRIFGFNLPEKIFVIPKQNYNKGRSRGFMFNSKPVIITLTINNWNNEKELLAVMLHEILHAKILEKDIINRKKGNSIEFEEPLIQYFAPFGILSGESHLIKKDSIENYNKRDYTRFIEVKDKLLPIIKKYYEDGMKSTIWDYLKNTEFKKYINRKNLNN